MRSASGEERRRDTRFPIDVNASSRLIVIIEGNAGPVQVRNLSIGGIGLVLDRGYDIGTLINLQLLKRPSMVPCKVEVRVTYVMEHPCGEWVLGGAFNRKLTEPELQALLK